MKQFNCRQALESKVATTTTRSRAREIKICSLEAVTIYHPSIHPAQPATGASCVWSRQHRSNWLRLFLLPLRSSTPRALLRMACPRCQRTAKVQNVLQKLMPVVFHSLCGAWLFYRFPLSGLWRVCVCVSCAPLSGHQKGRKIKSNSVSFAHRGHNRHKWTKIDKFSCSNRNRNRKKVAQMYSPIAPVPKIELGAFSFDPNFNVPPTSLLTPNGNVRSKAYERKKV